MKTPHPFALATLLALAVAACDSPVEPASAPAAPDPGALEDRVERAAYVGAWTGPEQHRSALASGPRLAELAVAASTTELETYSDRGAFEAAAPGLPVEDFEGATPTNPTQCIGPVSSETDNACFSPGALIPGFSLEAITYDRLVVLTPPVLEITSVAVGPDAFEDNLAITFSDGGVHAVSLNLLAPMGGPGPVAVELFDGEGVSLGTLQAQAGASTGVFWGVISTVTIGRLMVTSDPEAGLLVDALSFGVLEQNEASGVVVQVLRDAIQRESRGVIPVAVLSTPDFDATAIDAATVRFGPGEAAPRGGVGRIEDVDGDGVPDMVFHFPTPEAGFGCDDTEAELHGETLGGQVFSGTDSVRILCRPDPPAGPRGGGPRLR